MLIFFKAGISFPFGKKEFSNVTTLSFSILAVTGDVKAHNKLVLFKSIYEFNVIRTQFSVIGLGNWEVGPQHLSTKQILEIKHSRDGGIVPSAKAGFSTIIMQTEF